MPRLLGTLLTALVFGLAGCTAGVGAFATDDTREAVGHYVASPADGGVYSPAAGAGLGRVEFDIRDGESRVSVTAADILFERTELEVVFLFGDAPIRHVVTFCRQHTMDIPSGATGMRVGIERLSPGDGDSTCGGDQGATTGTVTARFA